MKPKAGVGYVVWGVLGGVAAVAFAGCTEGSEAPAEVLMPHDGGAAGEATESEQGGGGQVAGEGSAPVGGGGGAGGASSGAGGGNNVAGEGGGAEVAESTFPLSRADVVRIAGTSFTTPSEPGVPACASHASDLPAPVLDHLQLAFVANGLDAIDVVASTRGPWLSIHRSRLLRGETGYVIEDPPPTAGCMAYHLEDGYRPSWATPARLALQFSGKDEAGRVTSMSVQARFVTEEGAEVLTATGLRDVTAPEIVKREPWVYGDEQQVYYYRHEESPSWELPQRFEFTEALRPGWSVALENDAGDHFLVATDDGLESSTGFDVVQFFPPGFHWVVMGADFANNAVVTSPYPSALPPLQDGAFEAEGDWPECEPMFEFQAGPCAAAAVPGAEAVTALAGTRSLFIGGGGASLRVARVADARRLVFRARALNLATATTWSLRSQVQALDAGSSASARQQTTDWVRDDELSDGTTQVSAPRDVILSLPPGSADVRLSLTSSSSLWIDSVRTE